MHPIDTPKRQSWNFENKDPLTTKLTIALYNTIRLHPINNNRFPRKKYYQSKTFKKKRYHSDDFTKHTFIQLQQPLISIHKGKIMRFTILLAALSASTLITALPTVNSTDPFAYDEELENGIEKRGTYGWLSNYAMTGIAPLLPLPFSASPLSPLRIPFLHIIHTREGKT